MTGKEFLEEMNIIQNVKDAEIAHGLADDLLCKALLFAAGFLHQSEYDAYIAGVERFRVMKKWYA
ncbi:MAG: hypothetical protein GY807_05390 [Gammaproteobacteria bacterium]|nr:hypothetical protein [Gammaproteobacteria bacterium]